MNMARKLSGQSAKEGERGALLGFGLIPVTIKTHKSNIPEFRQEDEVCFPTLANHPGRMFQGFIF
jgi:hypothetical protein